MFSFSMTVLITLPILFHEEEPEFVAEGRYCHEIIQNLILLLSRSSLSKGPEDVVKLPSCPFFASRVESFPQVFPQGCGKLSDT
jgi:hypothetical protein